MPYIITTLTPTRPDMGLGVKQQHAVATLEEAHDVAYDALRRAEVYDQPVVELVPEHGGTIGPLPDGTVIEVRPLSWLSLFHEADRRAVRLNPDASHEAIVASYNALQGEAS